MGFEGVDCCQHRRCVVDTVVDTKADIELLGEVEGCLRRWLCGGHGLSFVRHIL